MTEQSSIPVEAQAVPDLHQQYVYVRLIRPEGYEDVHPELLVADAHIHPAFEPEIVAASPAAAADLDLFNEACAILSAVMSYELPTELKHRIVNVLCTDASPVAPVGAPTEAQLRDMAARHGCHPDNGVRFARALLSRQGCELATDATKQLGEKADSSHLALSTSSMPTAAPLLSSRETDRSELPRGPLVDRLRDEADLCANEGADDIARLLNEAADALIGESQ